MNFGDEVVSFSGHEGANLALNGIYKSLAEPYCGASAYFAQRTHLYMFRHIEGNWWGIATSLGSRATVARVVSRAPTAPEIEGVWQVYAGDHEGWVEDSSIKIVEEEEAPPDNVADAVVVKCRFGHISGGYRRQVERGGAAIYFNEVDSKTLWYDGRKWCISNEVSEMSLFVNSMPTSANSPESAEWEGCVVEAAGIHLEPEKSSDEGFVDVEFLPTVGNIDCKTGEIEWVRAARLGYGQPALFNRDEPHNILSGALGDCWLTAAIAAVAEFPSYIETHIFASPFVAHDGKYSINLYDGLASAWQKIVVDDFIPCEPKRWYDNQSVPIFSKPNDNEPYVLLIEKALAKLVGSYDALMGGHECIAWMCLTGHEEQLIWNHGDNVWRKAVLALESMRDVGELFGSMCTMLTDEQKSDEEMFEYLMECDTSNFMVAASIPGGRIEKKRPDGLVERHAYSLLSVMEVEGFRLIRLRNPWGSATRWKGPWSDSSPEWEENPEVANALGLDRPGEPEGTFFMSWVNFRRIFVKLHICPMDMGKRRATHTVPTKDVCTACGNKFLGDAKFCRKCGKMRPAWANPTVVDGEFVSTGPTGFAWQVFLFIGEAMRWRTRLADRRFEGAVLFMQKKRRTKVELAKKAIIRDKLAMIFLSKVMTLSARMEHFDNRCEVAARALQRQTHQYLTKRRQHKKKLINLQRMLHGLLGRHRAFRYLMDLRTAEARAKAMLHIVGLMETIANRKLFCRCRERSASVKIQCVIRGMLVRHQVFLWRQVVCKRRIQGASGRHAARHILLNLAWTNQYENSSTIAWSKVQTILLRATLRRVTRLHWAASAIQRKFRGYMVRLVYRDMQWQRRAVRSLKRIASMYKKYAAQHMMLQMQDDFKQETSESTWKAVVETVELRMAFERYILPVKLQCRVRGWKCRFITPESSSARAALHRTRNEIADRTLQKRQVAAGKVQAQWRAWSARQHKLLPLIINQLAIQRHYLQVARVEEAASVWHLRGGNAELPLFVPGRGWATIVHAGVPPTAAGPHRFLSSAPVCSMHLLAYLEQRGETFLDIGLREDQVVAVSTTGAVWACQVVHPVTACIYLGKPRVNRVSCGACHSLAIMEQGLLLAWGSNEHGQCGVGTAGPSVEEPTVLQRWALKSHGAAPGFGQLPFVQMCACGSLHSAVLDTKGALWLWGSCGGVGLANVVPTAAVKVPGFLLFNLFMNKSREAPKAATGSAMKAGGMVGENNKEGAKDHSRDNAKWLDMSADVDALLDPGTTSGPTMNTFSRVANVCAAFGRDASEDIMDSPPEGSSKRLLYDAQAIASLEEVPGDVLEPMRCCVLIVAPAAEAQRLGTVHGAVLQSAASRNCASIVPAPAHGQRFIDMTLSANCNFALSEKGFLYSWGVSLHGMLGRPWRDDRLLAAPCRIPLFPQLAVSVSLVAAGASHVVVLTAHGRVFTWGSLEACLGTEGFRRHAIEEPVFVEGALRDLRAVRVGAGQVETVVATEHFHTIVGWELLESSSHGKRLKPAIYQYVLTGPEGSCRRADKNLLYMPFSSALQLVLLGSNDEDGFGDVRPEATVKTLNKSASSGAFPAGFRNADAKKRETPSVGREAESTAPELFEWAARLQPVQKMMRKEARPTWKTTRANVASSHTVTASNASRLRDALALDDDIAGYRRLELIRKRSKMEVIARHRSLPDRQSQSTFMAQLAALKPS